MAYWSKQKESLNLFSTKTRSENNQSIFSEEKQQPTDCAWQIKKTSLPLTTRITATQAKWWKHTSPDARRIKAPLVSSHQFLDSCDTASCTEGVQDEWDANLSWHVKLWLDQITRCSTIKLSARFSTWRLRPDSVTNNSRWPCRCPSCWDLSTTSSPDINQASTENWGTT